MNEAIEINKVRIYKCDTWENFISEVRKPRFRPSDNGSYHFGKGALFRGHGDPAYKLSSTMERDISIKVMGDDGPETMRSLRSLNGLDWYRGYCDDILTGFRARSYGLSDVSSDMSDIEAWSVGRHFGLLSPYLDWTLSPFVAAFFALEEIYKSFSHARAMYGKVVDGYVTVWGLRQWDNLTVEGEFDLFYVNGQVGSRMRAQQGCFTCLFSKDFVDVESYLHSVGKAHYLERYELNKAAALEALYDLNLMNINYSTLFPGPVGAALHSNINAEVIRNSLIIPFSTKGR